MAASLLKGFDVEEAVLLLAVLSSCEAPVPLRPPGGASSRRFSPAWIAAVVGAVAASVWLGSFAFKHVDYARDLWWQFELRGEASRFLRASVGAAVVSCLSASPALSDTAARGDGADRSGPRRRGAGD